MIKEQINRKDLVHIIHCQGWKMKLIAGTPRPIFSIDGSVERYESTDNFKQVDCERCKGLKKHFNITNDEKDKWKR